jgi:hypothetical protein
MEKGGHYYEFFYNTRSVKPTILHFQVGGFCNFCVWIADYFMY